MKINRLFVSPRFAKQCLIFTANKESITSSDKIIFICLLSRSIEIDDIIKYGFRNLDLILYGCRGAYYSDIHLTYDSNGYSNIKSCTVASYDPEFMEYYQLRAKRYRKYGGHIDWH